MRLDGHKDCLQVTRTPLITATQSPVRMGEQPGAALMAHIREIEEKDKQEEGGGQNSQAVGLKLGIENQEKGKEKYRGETVIVAEGLRPLPRKIVLRIQSWEFIDLEELLQNPRSKIEVPLAQRQEGVLVVQSLESLRKRKPRMVGCKGLSKQD